MIFGVRGVCPLKFYYVNAEGAKPVRQDYSVMVMEKSFA